MKGEIYNPGQPHKKEDFDNQQNSQDAAIRERLVDLLYPGIIVDSQTNGEPIPFQVLPDSGLSVRVLTGGAIGQQDSYLAPVEAIDASDTSKTGGERIRIPVADTTSSPSNNYQRSPGSGPGTGTGTGPFMESSDGMSGWVSTPQSTMTRNIPLTNGVLNYLWIAYLNTTDPTVTSIHKVNISQLLYPHRGDGYDIVVTTSFAPPGGDPKYLYVCTVDLTASPAFVTTGMISTPSRAFSYTRANRVAFKYDSTLAVLAAPTNGTIITLESFLNSRGTGTVTPTNILGLSLADLGFSEDVNLINHEHYHHSPGLVVPSIASTTSALYPQIQSGGFGGSLYTVGLKALTIGGSFPEQLVVSGLVAMAGVGTPIFPPAPSPLGSNVSPGDPYIGFGTGDPVGVYSVYIYINGTQPTIAKTLSYAPSPNTFLVNTVSWNGSVLSSLIDFRLFGTVSSANIQASGVAAGTYGDSSHSPILAIGADGRVTSASTAFISASTNLAGGTLGDLPYQTGPGATAFVAPGTTAQILTSVGVGAPVWTSPQSANAASTVVTRDGSGNFAAGTITADLTGSATAVGGVVVAPATAASTFILTATGPANATWTAPAVPSSLTVTGGGTVTGDVGGDVVVTPAGSGKVEAAGDLDISGNIFAGGVQAMIFGGFYCSASGSMSGSVNPLTGGFSCPVGFTATTLMSTGGLGSCSSACVSAAIVMCWK